ncbi:hypothetical protein SELMODRAFT_441883 [Selaginella moellendorffii]|uniref:Uncharacterized protein n=1 Tax=Selaginella moellendorffii TaxID=88036 RepID=D8RNG1_SELML|nr:hypothetical protein SELMODRAFT_441883 [Selaginella moellendorffii]
MAHLSSAGAFASVDSIHKDTCRAAILRLRRVKGFGKYRLADDERLQAWFPATQSHLELQADADSRLGVSRPVSYIGGFLLLEMERENEIRLALKPMDSQGSGKLVSLLPPLHAPPRLQHAATSAAYRVHVDATFPFWRISAMERIDALCSISSILPWVATIDGLAETWAVHEGIQADMVPRHVPGYAGLSLDSCAYFSRRTGDDEVSLFIYDMINCPRWSVLTVPAPERHMEQAQQTTSHKFFSYKGRLLLACVSCSYFWASPLLEVWEFCPVKRHWYRRSSPFAMAECKAARRHRGLAKTRSSRVKSSSDVFLERHPDGIESYGIESWRAVDGRNAAVFKLDGNFLIAFPHRTSARPIQDANSRERVRVERDFVDPDSYIRHDKAAFLPVAYNLDTDEWIKMAGYDSDFVYELVC